MRHNVKKTQLNLPRDQRRILLKNLATSLIIHEKIETTQAKAKALKSFVEKLIVASKGDNKLVAIRRVNAMVDDEKSAKKLIDTLCKRYENKTSGFTRITKLGFRAGDAAPIVSIELT